MRSMARKQAISSRGPGRGLLARPLDALVFLLPLLLFCEIASFRCPDRVIAFDVVSKFFELFGHVGVLAPGLAVIAILIATHAASGEPWRIHGKIVAMMYVEAGLLAVPLLALSWIVPLTAGETCASGLFNRLAFGVGAGVYEELVFRLILISFMIMIGADLFHWRRSSVAMTAIIASSLLFAAHHHQPIGQEPFDLLRFAFRSSAGMYLALVFWFRGYGPAAGCHAAYNVALMTPSLMP